MHFAYHCLHAASICYHHQSLIICCMGLVFIFSPSLDSFNRPGPFHSDCSLLAVQLQQQRQHSVTIKVQQSNHAARDSPNFPLLLNLFHVTTKWRPDFVDIHQSKPIKSLQHVSNFAQNLEKEAFQLHLQPASDLHICQVPQAPTDSSTDTKQPS
jgi:hypothetical protein